MAAHCEKDFIQPIIQIVKSHKQGCYMSDIIRLLPDFIELTEEDKQLSLSRAGEPKYKQIVRNLVSHKNKDLLASIDIIVSENNRKNLFRAKSVISGEKSDMLDNSNELKAEDICFFDKYDLALEKQMSSPSFSKPQRSNSLAEQAKKEHNYECQYSRLIGAEQPSNSMVDAHHFIPFGAWTDFEPKSLDRPSNLVVLSNAWHDILHRGNFEEKRKILTILYDELIVGLNRDYIWISLDDLLKYYR